MTEGIRRFWTPPNLGERILSMCQYCDFIVVCTTDGVYTITPPGHMGLDEHIVRKITHAVRATANANP